MAQDVTFSPASWDKGGSAFTEEGTDFQTKASTLLGAMTIEELECNNGGTIADAALGLIMPALLSAMSETATGISGGVGTCGDAMTATATAYRNTERYNTDAAGDAGTTT